MLRAKNILFPTDFSAHADHAAAYALAVAQKYGAVLHIVHCVDCTMYAQGTAHSRFLSEEDLRTLENSMREHAENQMQLIVGAMPRNGVHIEQHVVIGKPDREILRLAEEIECELIVISTHGRSGLDHIVFGSVCEKIVRQSRIPVLTVKRKEHEFVDEATQEIHLHRVLFPFDFSELSERALPLAASLCREFGAELVIVHVNDMPPAVPDVMPDITVNVGAQLDDYAKQTMERLSHVLRGVAVQFCVVLGIPHREIARLVEDASVDLIVMATHGRSGVSHILFGSVAEKVVRTAQCPVLTLRPVEQRVAAQLS